MKSFHVPMFRIFEEIIEEDIHAKAKKHTDNHRDIFSS